MAIEDASARCCIAGGGPAGMMLGLLLARAGVEVIVLEKHADFLRDFRGDTIHPSTLGVMHELGLLERFLALPHQEIRRISARVGDTVFAVADFSHLGTRCPFIAFMPQWDFLDFLADEAARYPTFALRMRSEVVGLVEEGDHVAGVRVKTPAGVHEVRADLVVAADGRYSLVRAQAGLPVTELGAPMDVLWFRLARRPEDASETMGRFGAGRILVMIDRGDHWQCGYVIPKGALDAIQQAGLDAFRREIATLATFGADRLAEIGSWEDVKLLTVRIDRARRWYRPGLLVIGDAAHAMSPIGGVGVNLAVQDAVAAANLLAAPLAAGRLTVRDLQRVQRRRKLPTGLTQWMQVQAQQRVVRRVLSGTAPPRPPLALRLLARSPLLRRIPGRLIGMGVRPEHVRTPVAVSPIHPAARGARTPPLP